MTAIYLYRVNLKRRGLRRTWQAEWEGVGMCPRGFTERGTRHKAARRLRWSAATTDLYVAWCRWLRAYVTHRNDPYYAKTRESR